MERKSEMLVQVRIRSLHHLKTLRVRADTSHKSAGEEDGPVYSHLYFSHPWHTFFCSINTID